MPLTPAQALDERVSLELESVRAAGAYKTERVIGSTQGARVRLVDGRELVNLCANNYLGLANDTRLVEAAAEALRSHGLGLASVRFICGTQDLHKTLETSVAEFLGTEDAVLYAAAFDANGGLFEPLLGEPDAVISDELNHASIIDGIRLCKARRWRYRHNDMADLERCLKEARQGGARSTLVFTDGVFSMDGTIAQLDRIKTLCDSHGALMGIDECHATGVLGPQGRGTHAHFGLVGQVDLITGTFGKALGGASGGFTACSYRVADLLRQRSRPYLFSNTLAPPIVGASLCALQMLREDGARVNRLAAHALRFRAALEGLGYTLKPGSPPIVPVMLGDEHMAKKLAAQLLALGLYVVSFSHPVVPRGQARIRVQLSAAHSEADLQLAIAAFAQAGHELGIGASRVPQHIN